MKKVNKEEFKKIYLKLTDRNGHFMSNIYQAIDEDMIQTNKTEEENYIMKLIPLSFVVPQTEEEWNKEYKDYLEKYEDDQEAYISF